MDMHALLYTHTDRHQFINIEDKIYEGVIFSLLSLSRRGGHISTSFLSFCDLHGTGSFSGFSFKQLYCLRSSIMLLELRNSWATSENHPIKHPFLHVFVFKSMRVHFFGN
uniref:Uncharacterized protein n=1 Tax=Micrurus corallinus TaxID=54390 RepID=A0A2D4F1A0_MICCO